MRGVAACREGAAVAADEGASAAALVAEEGAAFFTHLKTVFFDYTGQARTSKIY